jgi:hypothetical protein
VFTPFHKPPYTYPYGRSVDKTTTPKVIWFPSIFELLFERSEKGVKFMILMPKLLMVGAN